MLDEPGAETPYLLISRNEIQFNQASNYTLDVNCLSQMLDLCREHKHALAKAFVYCRFYMNEAVKLYRGDFLESLILGDSPEFESWAEVERERLKQIVLRTLFSLAGSYIWLKDYEKALVYARKQLTLDPWREQALRQIMFIQSATGERNTALNTYNEFRAELIKELGIEPAKQTQALRLRIIAGQETGDSASSPGFQRPVKMCAFLPVLYTMLRLTK